MEYFRYRLNINTENEHGRAVAAYLTAGGRRSSEEIIELIYDSISQTHKAGDDMPASIERVKEIGDKVDYIVARLDNGSISPAVNNRITEPHELIYTKCVRVESKKKIWRAGLDKLLGKQEKRTVSYVMEERSIADFRTLSMYLMNKDLDFDVRYAIINAVENGISDEEIVSFVENELSADKITMITEMHNAKRRALQPPWEHRYNSEDDEEENDYDDFDEDLD